MQKIVLASHNSGKLNEFKQLCHALPFTILPQSEFTSDSIEETGCTYIENALIKARHAAKIANLPTIADDSGVAVDYLDGKPGIYSARFAGDNASSQECIDKLLALLQGVPFEKRTATFHCTLVYLRSASDPDPIICQGRWHGFILEKMSGSNGFGYDPIFYVPKYQCAAAELTNDLKSSICHRGIAMAKLAKRLTQLSISHDKNDT